MNSKLSGTSSFATTMKIVTILHYNIAGSFSIIRFKDLKSKFPLQQKQRIVYTVIEFSH